MDTPLHEFKNAPDREYVRVTFFCSKKVYAFVRKLETEIYIFIYIYISSISFIGMILF